VLADQTLCKTQADTFCSSSFIENNRASRVVELQSLLLNQELRKELSISPENNV